MDSVPAPRAPRYVSDSEIDIERLRSDIRLSDIVGRVVTLKKSGQELAGLCPFHEERTPSFFINDDKGLYHCFGCAASGDVIDFVRTFHALSFLETIQWLSRESPYPPITSQHVAQHLRINAARRALRIGQAKAEWRSGMPIAGTPAETYLCSRGIRLPVPGSLRFGMVPVWFDDNGRSGPRKPALIAACQDADGAVTGIQRIFLTHDGQKAPMYKPKMSLGQIRGGALRLGPEAAEMVICEGPEDGLTLCQRWPDRSVWVALGTGNMSEIRLPPIARRVLVAGDNDDPGREAVRRALETLRARHRVEARPVFPRSPFRDFNEELVTRLDAFL